MTDWETIVSQHVGVVWRAVHRLVGNHADAWDCVKKKKGDRAMVIYADLTIQEVAADELPEDPKP